jgi:putative ABC transport system permease protein
LVITLFAIIALLLSAAGLYGVTTQAFGQRTSEIGLRIAVGATRLQIMSVLLKRTLACVAGGLALGLLGAIAIGRVIQGALIQSTRTDTSLLVGVALLLMVVVCAACVVPVRRAIRLDPVAALRHE